MKIEIPDRFLGKPIKGAMDKILKEVPKREKSKNASPIVAPSSSNLTDADKYILLPSMQHGNYSYPDTLVSMEKNHFNKDWNKTHEVLKKEEAYMLTIRQFADFLSLLKSGKAFDGTGKQLNKGKLENVLQEITEVRDPWRSEWLDAKFEDWNILYHKFDGSTKTLVEVKEPLYNYIKTDKESGISLSDWLKKANVHGLPTPKTNNGSLCYYAPVNGKVAGFYVGSGRALLYCVSSPANAVSSLGVRVARAKN